MKTRVLAALIALPLAVIPIWLGGIWCALLFLAVAIVAGLEFYNILGVAGFHPNLWVGLAWITAFVAYGWDPDLFPLAAVLMLGLIVSLTAALRNQENPAGAWMSTSMVAIYLGVATGQTLILRQSPEGLWWLVYGLAVVWINDSMAYFVGVTWGQHKLSPRLSPKKSWEGTVGGWVGATLSSVAVVWLTPLPNLWWQAALFGTACGVLALLGDLAMSMVKRQAGVKDSGHFMPGHGGILDRLDSMLFVLPFIAVVVLLFT